MAFVSAQVIDAIAHSIDIPKLAPDAAQELAQDVEYKLRELIQDAQKFVRHSRRQKLTTEDINNALRLRNAEPLYGFANKDPAHYIKAAGHADLYCIEDREVAVEQVADAPLPRPPVEVGLMPHWLFIKGVQPLTPENTPLERPPVKRLRGAGGGLTTNATTSTGPGAAPASTPNQGRTGEEGAAGAAAGGAGPGDSKSVQVQLPVQHVLPLELQLYFTKALEVIGAALQDAKAGQLRGAGAANGSDAAANGEKGSAGPGAQPTYWGDMGGGDSGTNAHGSAGGGRAAREGDGKLAAVLASLETDPGLHPLAPYFVKFLCDEVTACLPHPGGLLLLLRTARALLRNDSVGLDRHVHQLLPALLTCVVAKGIGKTATGESTGPCTAGGPDHWAVRDSAAQLAAEVCARFGAIHVNVQPRVSKTLLKALLDPGKPLTTHYGAVVGLAALGPTSVRTLLLPQLPAYLQHLQPLLQGDASGAPAHGTGAMDVDGSQGGGAAHAPSDGAARSALQADALRVQGALVDAAVGALYELMTQAAAGAVLPGAVMEAGKPSSATLALVAQALQHTGDEQSAPVGAGHTPAPQDDRSRAEAILAVCWQEHVPLSDVAWAAGEVLGPAFAARMPQARPAQALL